MKDVQKPTDIATSGIENDYTSSFGYTPNFVLPKNPDNEVNDTLELIPKPTKKLLQDLAQKTSIQKQTNIAPKKQNKITQFLVGIEEKILQKYNHIWELLEEKLDFGDENRWRELRKALTQKLKTWVKKHTKTATVILLILAVSCYFIFGAIRQSIGNIEQSKTSLIDQIKSILGKNDQDQIDTLNEIEAKLIADLDPLVSTPIIGLVVKNDIAKIKNLVAMWLDALYPFANYKLGVDGFKTVLLQERYFTQDVESFLDKVPSLISETKWQMGWFGIYQGSSQLKDIFSLLNIAMDILEILYQKKEIILTMLGHYQTQKIVIFNQNTGEARPTGGFIGSYIPINISKGEINIGQSQSVYWFDKGVSTNLLSHPAMWYYGWFNGSVDPHGARNSNVFACFPDTARYLEREFAKTENGYNIDNMVFITPQYLIGYLPENFVLEINGDRVPKLKILEKIEQITAIEIEDKLNPKKQLTSIFNLIVKQLPEILKGQALVNLITYTQESLLSRDIQVWFRSQKTQTLWSSTGFAGEQTCQNKHPDIAILTPLLVNMSGDKRNLVSSTNFEITKKSDSLNIKWTQTLPLDIKQQLKRIVSDDGITMIGFQLPKNAKIVNITSPNILQIPFVRDYYIQQLELENLIKKGKYTTPPEIKKVIQSSYDLPNSGFSYIQPDGSEVIGVMVRETLDTPTVVEFDIDISKSNTNLVFYGQTGLNSPTLSIDGRVYNNSKDIQKGVKIG